eukprot:NODE_265_length_11346_cov_0.635814.p13 type:complete len:109 gc:universal NODE_265_length_11346_cov_0.635814:8641-8967(+)
MIWYSIVLSISITIKIGAHMICRDQFPSEIVGNKLWICVTMNVKEKRGSHLGELNVDELYNLIQKLNPSEIQYQTDMVNVVQQLGLINVDLFKNSLLKLNGEIAKYLM